jgi:polyisoprenoid-binding protein YceI
MASVESGSEARDEHIKSPELLDVEQFPTALSAAPAWSGVEAAAPCTRTSPSTE